jgi:hypothetical protein
MQLNTDVKYRLYLATDNDSGHDLVRCLLLVDADGVVKSTRRPRPVSPMLRPEKMSKSLPFFGLGSAKTAADQ